MLGVGVALDDGVTFDVEGRCRVFRGGEDAEGDRAFEGEGCGGEGGGEGGGDGGDGGGGGGEGGGGKGVGGCDEACAWAVGEMKLLPEIASGLPKLTLTSAAFAHSDASISKALSAG